jgi:hypothetical protein
MPDRTEAQGAIQNLNGKELLGRQTNVDEVHPRNDRGRSGDQRRHRDRTAYGGARNRY